MRLDHSDYIKLVTKTYFKKRHEPFFILPKSAPARIKRACLRVFEERYRREDEQILKGFFGPAKSEQQLFELMEDFLTDRFRPLDTYLKKEGRVNTDDKNVELLAWLIDFKHRPYVYDMQVMLTDDELALLKEEENQDPPEPEVGEEEDDDEEPLDPPESESKQADSDEPVNIEENEDAQVQQEEPAKPVEDEQQKIEEEPKKPHIPFGIFLESGTGKGKSRRIIIIFLAAVISAAGGYGIWQHGKAGNLSFGNTNTGGCMYWANDHYEQVPCNEAPKGRLILPLNEEKMNRFKRIMQVDTITQWSIGKTYYAKNNNIIEYYTSAGTHPVHITDTLKVLSRYMFNAHLRQKETDSGKDSLAE